MHLTIEIYVQPETFKDTQGHGPKSGAFQGHFKDKKNQGHYDFNGKNKS